MILFVIPGDANVVLREIGYISGYSNYPYSARIYYIYKIFYSIYAKRDTLLLSRIKPSLRQFEFGASLATKVLLTFCI